MILRKWHEKRKKLGEIGLENFAPYLMNRIMGRYNISTKKEMLALGLTVPQMRTLAVLSVIDGISIKMLAVYTVSEQSTISRALDSLDASGQIRRQSDADDNRAVRVFITDKGRTTFERIWPHMAQAYEEMFKNISPEDRRQFIFTLQAILANVRKHEF